MPTNMHNLRENLHVCFSKLKQRNSTTKKLTSSDSSSSSITTKNSTISQLLTKSPAPHDHKTETTAFFIKNFNSLYNSNDHSDNQPSLGPPHLNSTNSSSSKSFSSSSSSSSSEYDPAAATVGSDGRFFFSSPGRTKSIVDDEAMSVVFSDDGGGNFGIVFAIPTYSTDPCADFRRSMEEMVVAQDWRDDAEAVWDYLHGLLLCYLALNRKNTHKFILAAFNDLLLSLPPASHA